jgi:hypothetical protein
VVWALEAAVGVIVLLLTGVLASAIWTRRAVTQDPRAFRCVIRSGDRSTPALRRQLDRHGWHALWVHDVLLLHRGLGLRRITPVAVESALGNVSMLPFDRVRGLGRDNIELRLQLDDGRIVTVVAPKEDRELLVGPFVNAAMDDAPLHRRRRYHQ